MHIFRKILVGLASFIFIVSLTGFVYLFTLQTTILDRSAVKGWLNDSGLYDGHLIEALVQTTNAGNSPDSAPQPAGSSLSASPDAIKTALKATFTPDFTKTQIEGVIDSAYDWIDGTSPEFKFSIPLDQKRDTLIAELAKTIEPQIAALPVCQSIQLTQNSMCRPSNTSVQQLATELITQSVDQSGVLTQPLTNESFANPDPATIQQPGLVSLTELPSISRGVDTLLVVLPIAVIISLAVIIFATENGQRLARSARLSRRVFFSMLFLFLPSAIIVWLAKDNDFGLSAMFAAQASTLAVPLIKAIAVGMLAQLALVSGIIGAISLAAWITLSVLRRKASQAALVASVPQTTTEPAPLLPQSTEPQLQTPPHLEASPQEVPQQTPPNDPPRQ